MLHLNWEQVYNLLIGDIYGQVTQVVQPRFTKMHYVFVL